MNLFWNLKINRQHHVISEATESVRGSETSEIAYDVTNAFDDVICEAEKAMYESEGTCPIAQIKHFYI